MSKSSEQVLKDIGVLIVDCNPYMRRVTRTMLLTLGVRSVLEAADGIAALDLIRGNVPDVMVLDWDTPVLNGMELMRMVRSPGVFPYAKLPIVMLTYRAKRVHVLECMRVGVHEFLIKPTSAKALGDRLISIMAKPRPMMAVGEHYVPKPRHTSLPKIAQKDGIGLRACR
jgi:CheY-like chemotaxis protein